MRVKAFSGIERAARWKLGRLGAARELKDLRALAVNRFEALAGHREGPYSIRINDRRSNRFRWPDGAPGPSDAEIVDYHWELDMAVTAIHPGKCRAEELQELGLSAAELARRLDLPNQPHHGHSQRPAGYHRRHRLASGTFFGGTSAEFWLDLQSLYERRLAPSAEQNWEIDTNPSGFPLDHAGPLNIGIAICGPLPTAR
jgi:proteic killer suppression protein